MEAKRLFFVLMQFLRRDWAVFKTSIKDKIINSSIWMGIEVFINAYIMPKLGLPGSYGSFIFTGGIVVLMLTQGMMDASEMVADVSGEKAILYYLGLPIPAWLVFVRYAIVTGLKGVFLGLMSFPLMYFVLGTQFKLIQFDPVMLALTMLVQALFWGYFGLWVSSWTKNLGEYENVWLRITMPLWFLGCYNYSFHNLYESFGNYAYLALLNPFTYAMEGMRAALLGQHNFINFYYGCLVLLLCSSVMAILSNYTMKKRLDCV